MFGTYPVEICRGISGKNPRGNPEEEVRIYRFPDLSEATAPDHMGQPA
jgi:hypothetical protein